MKTVVIPSEYNPFHKGHEYQIKILKEEYGFDLVVAFMSGSCVQRGDFAIWDKKLRARVAVESGVDLVLQLPMVYSSQNAEMFAYGAVSEADKINAECICCGAENPEKKDEILKAARIIEEGKLKSYLASSSKSNVPYAAERINALSTLTGIDYSFLNKPNNILALEYARAKIRIKSDIELIFIKRNFDFKSSSQIREAIFLQSEMSLEESLPKASYDIYKSRNNINHSIKDYKDILAYLLTVKSESEINEIAESFDGAAERFKKNVHNLEKGVDNFVNSVNTKTVPNSRVRRILMNMLIEYTKNDYETFRNYQTNYIRILASNQLGLNKIRELKEKDKLLIITKLSSVFAKSGSDKLTEKDLACINFDIKAEDISNIGLGKPLGEDIRYTPYIKE